MKELCALVLETATKIGAQRLEESAKWGEPAYRCAVGSTVRLGWSPKTPDRVAVYFICTTGLIDHCRSLYPSFFEFCGDRALLFALDEAMARAPLEQRITMTLSHHRSKRDKA